jgi:ArsR family transcriptional regulator, arsenate/arsenite/antimonite-responsive transcriptional repressor
MAGPAVPATRAHDSVDVARLALLFHALSDETRLRIVGKLLHGEQCVCNLMDTLEAGQSRLSFHLKTLKDAGLVTDRRAGRWIHYSLNPGALAELQNFVGTVQANAARVEAARCCEEKKTSLGQLYGFSLF